MWTILTYLGVHPVARRSAPFFGLDFPEGITELRGLELPVDSLYHEAKRRLSEEDLERLRISLKELNDPSNWHYKYVMGAADSAFRDLKKAKANQDRDLFDEVINERLIIGPGQQSAIMGWFELGRE